MADSNESTKDEKNSFPISKRALLYRLFKLTVNTTVAVVLLALFSLPTIHFFLPPAALNKVSLLSDMCSTNFLEIFITIL